jgi:thioredoxin 1
MKDIHKGYNPDYAEEEPAPEQVRELSGDAVLEFGAPWCGYCQKAQPAIQEVLSEHPDMRHIKIYDGKGKRLGRAFGVKLWPTLILLRDSKEVARLVRPSTADEIRRLMK